MIRTPIYFPDNYNDYGEYSIIIIIIIPSPSLSFLFFSLLNFFITICNLRMIEDDYTHKYIFFTYLKEGIVCFFSASV